MKKISLQNYATDKYYSKIVKAEKSRYDFPRRASAI